MAEIQAMTDLSEEDIGEEMSAIQNLFLVSRPMLIDNAERFDINANTRSLVMQVYAKSEQLRKMTETYQSISDRDSFRHRGEIAQIIARALSLKRLRQQEEAEETLKIAIAKHTDDPDLVAHLGMIYAHWKPVARRVDARECFQRASQLRCKHRGFYNDWLSLEVRESEWSRDWSEAVRVGELGLCEMPLPIPEQYFSTGYAHSRYGSYFVRNFHLEKANSEFSRAEELLKMGLRDPEELNDANDRRLNSKIYRALVRNCEVWKHYSDMHWYMNQWLKEHPDESFAIEEAQRIQQRY